MTSVSSLNLSYLSLLCVAIGLVWRLYRDRSAKRLPSGPARLPFVGNAHEFYGKDALGLFKKWSTDYGFMTYFRIFNSGVLLINNYDLAKEVFIKRFSDFSDRPSFVMLGNLMEADNSFALMPYGAKWRDNRRIIKTVVHPQEIQKFTEDQNIAIIECISKSLLCPEHFASYLRAAVSNVILSALYGTPIDGEFNAEIIKDFSKTMEIVSVSAFPGAYILELCPRLRHLVFLYPYLSKLADQGKEHLRKTVTRPYDYAKRNLISGANLRDSFVSSFISKHSDDVVDTNFDTNLAWTAGSMAGAGTETTYATTLIFMVAMAQHLDVQFKVKGELRKVIKALGRLPTYEERSQLPYLEATLKEVLRWSPVLPVGLPRKCSSNVHVNGVDIPKDTIVLQHTWRISRDTNDKASADMFEPDRFLVSNPDVDPLSYVFGMGKRACPGQPLLFNTLFVFATSLMTSLKVELTDSKPIRYSSGLVRYPINAPLKIFADYTVSAEHVPGVVDSYYKGLNVSAAGSRPT